MYFAFFCLLMFNVMVGTLVFYCYLRITEHMRNNPEAARLVAEHVIAPLLTGRKEPKEEKEPEVTKTKDTLV